MGHWRATITRRVADALLLQRRSMTARAVMPSVPPTASGGHSPRKNRRRAVSYVSTGLARLPRDTGGTRNYRRSAVVETPRTIATYIVAERRNFSVTRYAERSGGVPEVRHYACPCQRRSRGRILIFNHVLLLIKFILSLKISQQKIGDTSPHPRFNQSSQPSCFDVAHLNRQNFFFFLDTIL